MCQGRNGWGNHGYDGPLGSVGRIERHRFRLLALDAEIALAPGAAVEELHDAVRDHVVDEAVLEASYSRPRT